MDHKIGNYYKHKNPSKMWPDHMRTHPYYILSQVDYSKVCLVCIHTGNRWREPVEVKNPNKISEDEWLKITTSASPASNKFVKIKVSIEENVPYKEELVQYHERNRCPVKKGTFGYDWGEFSYCEDCTLYRECARAWGKLLDCIAPKS
jgi:hypothetical protein